MTKQRGHKKEARDLEEELEVQEEIYDEASEEIEEGHEIVETSDAQIEELQAEVEKYKDLYVRSQAEQENLRRRTQIELEKRSKFAISSFAQDLLVVNDNLSRAMASIPVEERDKLPEPVKNLLIGLEMTQKEFIDAMEKNNIRPVESIGHIFNPNVHKVVQEVDDPTKPSGTIVQEWQKGYTIGEDRTLREAVVVVTKGGPRTGDEPTEAGHKIDTSA